MNRILEKLLVNKRLISWVRWVAEEPPKIQPPEEEVSLGVCYCGRKILPMKIAKLYVVERAVQEPDGGVLFVDFSSQKCQVGCVFCTCGRTKDPLDRFVVLDREGKIHSIAPPC